MGKGYEGSGKVVLRRTQPPHTFSVRPGNAREDEQQMEGLKALLYTLVFGAFLIAIYFLTTRLFHVFSILNEEIHDKFQLAQMGALGTLIAGVALFFLREHRRLFYAMLEISFALVTAGVAIGKVRTQGDLSVWIAVAASSYLVVRGMENMQKSGVTVSLAWTRFSKSPLVSTQGTLAVSRVNDQDQTSHPTKPQE